MDRSTETDSILLGKTTISVSSVVPTQDARIVLSTIANVIDYIYHVELNKGDSKILNEDMKFPKSNFSFSKNDDVITGGKAIILSRKEEEWLFVNMNHAYRQIVQMRKKLFGGKIARMSCNGREDTNLFRHKFDMDDQRTIEVPADEAKYIISWLNRANMLSDTIVMHNMFLVKDMIFKFNGPLPSDCFSCGTEELIKAVRRFDVSMGNKFSTYACNSIRFAFMKLIAAEIKYQENDGMAFNIASHAASQDNMDKQINNTVLVGFSEKEKIADQIYLLRSLLGDDCKLVGLTKQEKLILRLRFQLEDSETPYGNNLKDVGEIMGVSGERVRQIEKYGLGKLRSYLQENEITA